MDFPGYGQGLDSQPEIDANRNFFRINGTFLHLMASSCMISIKQNFRTKIDGAVHPSY